MVTCPEKNKLYQKGILLDVGFWLFGKELQDSPASPHFDPIPGDNPRQTYIWNTKKELWIQGPPLLGFQNHEYSYEYFSSLCPIALNRSTVLMLGGGINEKSNNSYANFIKRRIDLVFLVDISDFGCNSWKRLPSFPINSITNIDNDGIISKGGLSINKLGQR